VAEAGHQKRKAQGICIFEGSSHKYICLPQVHQFDVLREWQLGFLERKKESARIAK
jgi:hypothetical protein